MTLSRWRARAPTVIPEITKSGARECPLGAVSLRWRLVNRVHLRACQQFIVPSPLCDIFFAMAKLVFGMNMSLDGYVDHDHEGFAPDPAMFRYFIEQTRKAAGSIYGRGLYEVMRYWDGDNWDQDDPAMGDDLRAFAEAWRAMPKWVV